MNCIDTFRTRGGKTFAAVLVVALVLVLAGTASAQVTVTGAPNARLEDLVNSPTMVTVVLQPNGAQDPNLNIVELGPNYVKTKAADGTTNVYLFTSIKEIRVQGERIAEADVKVNVGRALNPTQRSVIARAIKCATDLFQGSQENQAAKMNAASLLAGNGRIATTVLAVSGSSPAANGDVTKSVEGAGEYLAQLAGTNDPNVSLLAGICLYLAGDIEGARRVVPVAMASSSRMVRIGGAELAGLTGDQSAAPQLFEMARDRAADVSAPAALSLAMLGNRDVIPTLLEMITDINSDRGDAAMLGLVTLGGEDVVEQMKIMLKDAQTVPRFRMAMVLFRLKDPLGEQLLAREFLQVPSLAREAALNLAMRGNARGLEYLRAKLDERMDVTTENYKFRARAAGALIEGGDRWAVARLQECLRMDNAEVQRYTCDVVSHIGSSALLSVVQPVIESSDPFVALSGCRAAFAIANPEFRARWLTAMPNIMAEPRRTTTSGGGFIGF